MYSLFSPREGNQSLETQKSHWPSFTTWTETRVSTQGFLMAVYMVSDPCVQSRAMRTDQLKGKFLRDHHLGNLTL